MNFRRWFEQFWIDDRARAVLAEYISVGSQAKLFLADIALRGGVFADPPPQATEYEAGFDAGRRSLALETITLCKADPAQLYDFVPKQPRGEAK